MSRTSKLPKIGPPKPRRGAVKPATALETLLLTDPNAEKAIDRMLCEDRLRDFVEVFWEFVEPAHPFVYGWTIDAICDHLSAVTSGQITRLLINVPPGFTKSLLCNVFYPAWEWGPKSLPSTRYVTASYAQSLTIRDNTRFRQIVSSDLYKEFWQDRFTVNQKSVEIVANNKTGWKQATSVGGTGTGLRGDRVLIDDPNSVAEAESAAVRLTTNQWFLEVIPTRMSNPSKSAIIVIQQRTNEDDVSGVILAKELDYEHLMVPMEYDSTRSFVTCIGWTDPRGAANGNPYSGPLPDNERAEHDGELAWPERFPADVVARDKATMGPFASAGQFGQSPVPRGGGIFKTGWWEVWPPADHPDIKKGVTKYPPLEHVVASLDTAYTEKEENDFSALTIWGIWRGIGGDTKRLPPRIVTDPNGMMMFDAAARPKVMLLNAWQKRLVLHGPPEREDARIAIAWCREELMTKERGLLCGAAPGQDHHELCPEYLRVRQREWGLVEWVVHTCRRYKVDTLLIEAKASGLSVSQELARLYGNEDWGVQMVNPRGDKVARAHSVVHLFSNGQIYAPQDPDGLRRRWCEEVVNQMANFPRGAHDDLVDSAVQALIHLRETGLALRTEESEQIFEDDLRLKPRLGALYDV